MTVDIKTAHTFIGNDKEKCYVIINDTFYIKVRKKVFDELNRFLTAEQWKNKEW